MAGLAYVQALFVSLAAIDCLSKALEKMCMKKLQSHFSN